MTSRSSKLCLSETVGHTEHTTRGAAEGLLFVNPNNFEAEVCNTFQFFHFSVPSLKPCLFFFFEKGSALDTD